MTLRDRLLSSAKDGEGLHEAVAGTAYEPGELAQAMSLSGDAHAAVRAALAIALPQLAEQYDATEPHQIYIDTAITLSRDTDGHVRDWACFALGQQWEVDTTEVREALAARLDDPDADARCEALLGLARRHDARALPRVQQALSRPDGSLHRLELVAAGVLSDPVLHPLVLQHQTGWDDDGPGGTADQVRRLTDPAGLGDDLIDGTAELSRRRSRGEGDGETRACWLVLCSILELAPQRAGEVFTAVEALLQGDGPALMNLHRHSALASMTGHL